MLKMIYFNPRSREGSDIAVIIVLTSFFDFNPRSREGSDEIPGNSGDYSQISIHAPARGATDLRYNDSGVRFISIHAPARGATCYAA